MAHGGEKVQMTDHDAMNEVMRDMLAYKKKEAKFLFIVLVISLFLNFFELCAFLLYETNTETIDQVSTTTQTVDGEGNDIVNGDQYNDQSKNQSGGDK